MININYYDEIKSKIVENEVYQKVKDYSKERNRVITYYEIGKLLNEAGGKYGDKIIDAYSKKLVIEVGKKYNRRTLFRMKQFYNMFCNEIVSPLATQLSWSHYCELLSIDSYEKIIYYTNTSIRENLSRNELRERIRNKEYERLPIETKDNIIGDTYNYIDLLLFNYEYNCFVVIELKVTELKKEHIGQIEVYMNYIDNNLRKVNQEKTIGIIICIKDNSYYIEYCSDKRIISREFIIG